MSSNRRAKFFSVSSFGLSQISNRSSYFFFLCPCLAVLESSSETLNGCVLTRPNKLVMPNSDWLLYTFVKQILQIGLIIFVCEQSASINNACFMTFFRLHISKYYRVSQCQRWIRNKKIFIKNEKFNVLMHRSQSPIRNCELPQ